MYVLPGELILWHVTLVVCACISPVDTGWSLRRQQYNGPFYTIANKQTEAHAHIALLVKHACTPDQPEGTISDHSGRDVVKPYNSRAVVKMNPKKLNICHVCQTYDVIRFKCAPWVKLTREVKAHWHIPISMQYQALCVNAHTSVYQISPWEHIHLNATSIIGPCSVASYAE